MTDYAAARFNMVESQIRPNRVTDSRLVEAMMSIPREAFVPAASRPMAYIDEDLHIDKGRYLMEPTVFARLAQAADITSRDVVLDVGCGTGYSCAVLSRLASVVVGVESDPDLAARATALMAEQGIDNVIIVTGPLEDGYKAQAPYDVVFVNGAVSALPTRIATQMTEGSRMVTVLKPLAQVGQGVLALRVGQTLSARALFDASTPYLSGFEPKPAFQF